MERRGLDGSRNNTPAANSGGLKRHWGMELLERLARSRPPMAMVTWNGSEHPVEGGGAWIYEPAQNRFRRWLRRPTPLHVGGGGVHDLAGGWENRK